jgi:tRNA-splicing ligase RtcB
MRHAAQFRMWTEGVPVEAEALRQLENMAQLPVLAGPIAVMPDVHLGKGATVGSVIPTQGAIIPAAVGVDIGCGMVALRTRLQATELPDSLGKIRAAIEASVPVGFNSHRSPLQIEDRDISLKQRQKDIFRRFTHLDILSRIGHLNEKRVWCQLGTLGGGNHFIELCLDEAQNVWFMLHSGSRNIGKMLSDAAISDAKQYAMRKHHQLADRDLAWLDEGTREFFEYTEALAWAQDYAALNRELMLNRILFPLERFFGAKLATGEAAVNCHHNYASIEEHFGRRFWITRKGAVSARQGELGIIPGSMGTRSYIVLGKGNPESYCSCSHGAGRRMSRAEAKRRYSRADLETQTQGVECRKDGGVLDEIPGAYKDIEAVMAAQSDLVEIVHTLKQVLCVKG